MKILIAYSSKHGTTKRCAEMLGKELSGSCQVSLCDVRAEDIPSPDGFDAVILGSSVRMARISKKIKKYMKINIEKLNAMPCAVFLCCGFPDEFDEYLRTELPDGFEPSYGAHCFGGELKPQNVKGFERFLVKSIRRSITEHDFEDGNYKGMLPEILPEHIAILAGRILGKHL